MSFINKLLCKLLGHKWVRKLKGNYCTRCGIFLPFDNEDYFTLIEYPHKFTKEDIKSFKYAFNFAMYTCNPSQFIINSLYKIDDGNIRLFLKLLSIKESRLEFLIIDVKEKG